MPQLLSTQITVLPNTDKDASIKSYIKVQRRNAPAYAAEGKVFQASWNEVPPIEPPTTPVKPSRNEESGFQTPVLKPRALRSSPPRKGQPPVQVQPCAKTPNPAGSRPAKQKLDTLMEPDTAMKPKKRRGGESVDEEHEDRLAERRARKRAKRDIMNPEEQSDIALHKENQNAPPSKPRSGKKGSKDKKTKLPAGLALLHGFTANNIGQKRITLQPGNFLGMFGKGKASVNTKARKNKSTKQISAVKIFSESRFLNPTVPKDGSSPPPSHVSDAKSDTNESKYYVSATPRPSQRKHMSASNSDAASEVLPSTIEKPDSRDAISEVWEIEQEDGSLASGTTSAKKAPVPASTVVLNTGNMLWGGANASLAPDTRCLSVVQEIEGIVGPSNSSSLCPSNSASQVPRQRVSSPKLPEFEPTSSRFFPRPADLQPTRAPVEEYIERSTSEVILEEQPAPSEHLPTQAPYSACPSNLQDEMLPEDGGTQECYSACGSTDSLQEALKQCEAYDHLFDDGLLTQLDMGPCEPVTLSVSDYAPCYFEDADILGSSEAYGCLDADQMVQLAVEDTFGDDDFMSDGSLDGLEMDHEACEAVQVSDEAYLDSGQDFDDFDGNDHQEEYEVGTTSDGYSHELPQFYHDVRMEIDEMDEEEEDFASVGEDWESEVISDRRDDVSDTGTRLAGGQFSQGRALLLGLSEPHPSCDTLRWETRTKTSAEEEVAKNLKGHWFPQRL